MKKPILRIAVAAVAGIFVIWVLLRAPEGSRTLLRGADPAQTPQVTTGKASSEVVLSIGPGVKRSSVPPPTSNKASPLILELRASPDNFKPIFDRLKALTNPSAEESYVLATMLEACAKVTDRKDNQPEPLKVEEAKARFAASLSPKAPHREKRIAAFDKALRSGCKGFEGVETTMKTIRDLLERSAAAGEPKAQARLLNREIDDARRDEKGNPDWNKPVSISDEQIERLKRIVVSGDPRALVDSVTVLMAWNADVHLRSPDEAPIDPQLLYHASTLAACDLGYPCGPDSPQVAGGCAFSGRCDAADYRDYVLFYELPPGNAQLVMQYHAQLLRVIQTQDWSYFTFQRGPAPGTAAFRRP